MMGWVTLLIGALIMLGGAVAEDGDWDLDDVQARTLRLLDDSNFEHDTQAATGQTTGSWLVLFTDSECGMCNDVESILLQLLSRSQEGLPILAKVNKKESPRTAKRFNVSKIPELKLFRNRRMFSYGGQWSAESIVAFFQDGWRRGPLEDVPKEVTLMSEIAENFHMLFRSIIEHFGNRPGILAGVGALTATGGYLFTKKWLTKKQNQKRPRKHSE